MVGRSFYYVTGIWDSKAVLIIVLADILSQICSANDYGHVMTKLFVN